jgi:hypothetical protein
MLDVIFTHRNDPPPPDPNKVSLRFVPIGNKLYNMPPPHYVIPPQVVIHALIWGAFYSGGICNMG